jgi:hypothetical protein
MCRPKIKIVPHPKTKRMTIIHTFSVSLKAKLLFSSFGVCLQNPSKFVKCKNSDQTTVPSQVAASQCYHLCRSTSDVIRVSAGDMNRSARNKHFSLLSLTVDWRSFSPESTVCLVGESRERERSGADLLPRLFGRGAVGAERLQREYTL